MGVSPSGSGCGRVPPRLLRFGLFGVTGSPRPDAVNSVVLGVLLLLLFVVGTLEPKAWKPEAWPGA